MLRKLCPRYVSRQRDVPEGLAVAADEVDLLRPDAGLSAKRLHRLNVQLSQKKIHFAEIRRAGAVSACQPQNFPANLPGKGLKYKAQLLDFWKPFRAR
mgnify:CR=1 FL=1